MKYRDNKGITGVDISVALVIVVLFVGIISTLVYNFGVTSKSIERKSSAVNIAMQKIEQLKNTEYENIQSNYPIEYRNKDGQVAESGPYTVNVSVKRYNDPEAGFVTPNEAEKIMDIIKIVTVTVSYTSQAEEQSVEFSTIITKED